MSYFYTALIFVVLIVSFMALANLLQHKFKKFFVNHTINNISAWCGFIYIVSVNTQYQFFGALIYISAILLFAFNHLHIYIKRRKE